MALQLWDVGSSVSSLAMAANYLHACDAVLVVHDLTRRQVRRACRAPVHRGTGLQHQHPGSEPGVTRPP